MLAGDDDSINVECNSWNNFLTFIKKRDIFRKLFFKNNYYNDESYIDKLFKNILKDLFDNLILAFFF